MERYLFANLNEFEKSAAEPLEHDIAPADSFQTVVDYNSSGEYSIQL